MNSKLRVIFEIIEVISVSKFFNDLFFTLPLKLFPFVLSLGQIFFFNPLNEIMNGCDFLSLLFQATN